MVDTSNLSDPEMAIDLWQPGLPTKNSSSAREIPGHVHHPQWLSVETQSIVPGRHTYYIYDILIINDLMWFIHIYIYI